MTEQKLKFGEHEILIDTEDLKKVCGIPWRVHSHGRNADGSQRMVAVCQRGKKKVYLRGGNGNTR